MGPEGYPPPAFRHLCAGRRDAATVRIHSPYVARGGRSLGGRLRYVVCALVVVVGGLFPPSRPGLADYDETEARLKAVGVDEPLRKQIHAAIDRGVAWLRTKQHADGGFPFDGIAASVAAVPLEYSDPGYTALCALALRHAGTPPAMAAFVRARKYLLTEGSEARRGLEGRVYESGLAAMIVRADGAGTDMAQAFADRLVRGQDSGGNWGYGTSSAGAVPPINLSTTQFGALGLWAAECTGARVDRQAWLRLAEGHCRTQLDDGGWAYNFGKVPVDRYPQGCFMGLADLLLAEGALSRGSPTIGATLASRMKKAQEKALTALARCGPAFLASVERVPAEFPGLISPYYSLFALEKACIFAGLEEVGGVRWYERGARALLARQAASGYWREVKVAGRNVGKSHAEEIVLEGRLETTAFALLFLVRSPQAYRPTTVRDPAPVTTPKDPPGEPAMEPGMEPGMGSGN